MMRDRQPLTPNKRPSPLAQLNQQPVVQAELNHQDRAVPRHKRRWLRWLGWIITILTYATAFGLLALEIVYLAVLSSGVRSLDYSNMTPVWFRALIVISVFAAALMHFHRMFQTLSLSANSIARERNANNWDMLVLTGIDAHKIVLGKWWATVRHMWRPYVRLGILRAIWIVSIGADTNRSYYSYAAYGSYRDGSGNGVILPMLLQFIITGVLIFTLTMVNLCFTAACGVSAFNRRGGIALARAIGTRLFLVIGLGLLGFLLLRLWLDSNYSSMVIVLSLLTIFDNGVIIGSQIATYNFYGYNSYGGSINPVFGVYLPAALISLLIYTLLTVLLLRLAQWQAVRNSAIPPIKRPLIKIV
jgi:hypothetical protein